MTDSNAAQAVTPAFVPVGERAQQLDMLLHLQEFSSMVVLLTGPTGVGKTALLEAAQSELQVHHQVIHIAAHKMMGEPDLFQQLSEALGCTASEAGVGVALNVAKNQSETIHVLVDDAHLLEPEALQYLVEVAVSDQGWHLILAGDAGVESHLRILQARVKADSLYHTLHLHPFSEEEFQHFLTAVYQQQGHASLPLSQQRVHQLWTLSSGLPGQVLDYLELESEKNNTLVARIPFGHIAAMLLVGMALVFSYTYDGEQQKQDPIAALLEHGQPSAELSSTEADERITALLSGAAVPTSAGGQQSSDAVDIPVEVLAQDVDQVDEQSIESSTPKSLSVIKSEVQTGRSTRPESVAKSTNSVKKTPKVQASHPLLDAPSETYALQLLGVRKAKSAQAFVSRLTKLVGQDQVNVYETRYKSAPWYVVVYGPFEDKNKARAAVKRLPKTMQQQRPWVRQLSKIQEDIRKAH